jgi:hypothetical protein
MSRKPLNGCNESQLTLQCRDKSHRKLQLYSFREDYFPSIKIYGETKYINLQWQVAPLDMKAEQPATVRHIQNRLKTAELAATVSLCPRESFDDISFLLRPFDPHQCGCTQSQSVFPMPHTMTDICETQPRYTTLRCCYCYSIESGGYKVGRLLAHYEPKGSFSMNLHYSSCRHCSTYYTWERFADLITLRRNTSGRA